MYKILKAEKLADKIFLMDVEAPSRDSSLSLKLMREESEFH